ncbi:MAG TPA: CheR family methyltransferase [Thermoanaerobaculia bacterium]|nr:CheR family methyltransferase [Thermoanaerobaculia bacterium]
MPSPAPPPPDFSGPAFLPDLAALIRERTGNLIPATRFDFLAEVAVRRARATGRRSGADYVRELVDGGLPGEWGSLIPLITIKESYFFRAPQQFEAIERQLLPRLLRARAGTRRLRIWSAACARGEEPATLAMVLAESAALAGWEWSILATDLDEEALAGARRGLYGERSVAQVPAALRERYFVQRGKLFELASELRRRIDFQSLNLAHPPLAVDGGDFDLVLLRNVLIYFRRALQSRVIAYVAQALARRGYLFLGAAETLWQIQDELEPVELGSCYCYRHRRPRQQAAVPVGGGTPGAAAAPAPFATSGPALAAPAATPARPAVSRSAPELLLAAARELGANRLEPAARAIEEALAADPSEPAAHALDGLLHDLAGRAEEAIASYRAALYLEPALFQARLLLADCLLRLGRRERADHHYREVLTSLEMGHEKPLSIFEELRLPDRERALHRCRQALRDT